jgi:hypothetical protein
MTVEHFLGKVECINFEELEKVLRSRTEKGVNEFIIYGDKYFPYLVMAVNDNYASLSYFWKDNNPGFSSIGSDTNLDEDGVSIFYTNNDKEEIEVANYSILPFSKALTVIKEFFETMSLPKCIEWEEL